MSEGRESKIVRTMSVETTSEERTAAALAHASSLLTLLISIATVGLGGVLFVFIPFVIYLSYKDRSRFVAYHAAQAFALQVAGTVGLFLGLIVGVMLIVIVWVITGVLSAILIGLILIPVATLVTLAVITILLGAPFVGMAFSVVGTAQTANGHDYRYPYVGQWVEEWLKRQEAEATPAV